MALEYFHEPREQLPAAIVERHRAFASLIEELEAANWYDERAAMSNDAELKAILEHNRNEELEHASMLLEWFQRKFPDFASELKTYLFTSAPITQVEELAEQGGAGEAAGGDSSGSLNIGSMKKG
jgi:ferritin-like protein